MHFWPFATTMVIIPREITHLLWPPSGVTTTIASHTYCSRSEIPDYLTRGALHIEYNSGRTNQSLHARVPMDPSAQQMINSAETFTNRPTMPWTVTSTRGTPAAMHPARRGSGPVMADVRQSK